MKKIFSILLLCCLLLNVIGYHIIFYIRQAEIKAEIKRSLLHEINNKDQEVFVFSLNDKVDIEGLEWEGDDEFRFNGDMYDVIEKKAKNEKLIVRCISDKKETALLNDYKRINNDGNSKDKSALLLKLVSFSFISESNTWLFSDQVLLPVKRYFQSEIISSHCDDVITPPPELS